MGRRNTFLKGAGSNIYLRLNRAFSEECYFSKFREVAVMLLCVNLVVYMFHVAI